MVAAYSLWAPCGPWLFMLADGKSLTGSVGQRTGAPGPCVLKALCWVSMGLSPALVSCDCVSPVWRVLKGNEGCMTAKGEVLDPDGLNDGHKLPPLPTHVKVTNLENRRSIILRVNERGPFVSGRIIDLSAGAAKRPGFCEKGTVRVLVETLDVPVQQAAEIG